MVVRLPAARARQAVGEKKCRWDSLPLETKFGTFVTAGSSPQRISFSRQFK
jgi:hypothetical protein